ncbi:TonB-dependent receptor plug domain-containing protein [Flavobacterium rhizosphaerae]|uniref:TonB-dependent receptor plug domain-containing protein n=1 Tax=Flavobacterium rhizosphaerae TaxID=3163298 RepID=A0ABW8YZT4_9FLAO
MIKHFRFFFTISVFIIAIRPVYAQDVNQDTRLKKILEDITIQHGVEFSYAEEDVRHFTLIPPDPDLPLKAKLIYIKNRTGLSFKNVKDYIVVFTDNVLSVSYFCAYVIDEYGYPVDKAIVQYDDIHTIVTGPDGYFELPKSILRESLNVTQTGYVSVSVKTDTFKRDCLAITLPLKSTELEEIIAERYLTTGIAKKKDGSFIITPNEFGILPGLTEPDVLQAMQQLPGINSIDQTVSNINVRGGTHDQNLFMWNGIRLFQTGHFFGLISALNPNLAHEIKIFKNGTSAFYGESVSSAIDISSHTKTIGTETTSISSNMISADMYTKIKTSENTNIELSGRRSFTDILDFPTYTKYSKRIFQNTVVTQLDNSTDVNYKSDKEFFFYDLTAQFHQKINNKHNLYVDVININNRLDFTQGTITSTNVVTKQSSLTQNTLGGTATWKAQWTDTHSSEIGIYGSYYDVNGTNSQLETDQQVIQENTIVDTGVHLENSNKLTPVFILHSGYQFNEIGIDNRDRVNQPSYNRNVKRVLRTHSVIGELEHNPDDQTLYIRAGLRANYIEQFGLLYFEPRLQFNYEFNALWQLEILAEQKSQSVSQIVALQNDFLGIENRRWILANEEDIPIQRSNQISAGVTYKDKGWLASLDCFYKRVDGITTYGQAFQNQFELELATGSYDVTGTELLLQKQFKDFNAWLSYGWNNNKYHFDGFTPRTFTSNFNISHAVTTGASYEWQKFKVALGSKWYSGRPTTNPLISVPTYSNIGTPTIVYNYPNTDTVGNFFEVNFSTVYTWQLPQNARLQIGLSIINIFNRSNILNRYYRISSEDNNVIEEVNTYGLQRTPNALIKLLF